MAILKQPRSVYVKLSRQLLIIDIDKISTLYALTLEG